MAILTYAAVLLTFWIVVKSWLYFRGQKKKIQKYPFFKLRDEIIWDMINADNPKESERIYRTVNGSIESLRHLDFNFLSSVITHVYSKMLEEEYRKTLGVTENGFDGWEPGVHDMKFARLVIKTAKENSWVLRLAMTRPAYAFMFAPSILRGVQKFRSKYPQAFRRRKKLRTVARYAYLERHCAV